MSVADLAIVAALVFGWGTLSARLERFDVTAPITFVLAGLLLTHGPLAVLGFAPSDELIKTLAEFIATGAYERHLRRTRRVNATRRAALLSAIDQHFADRVTVSGSRSGTHIVLWPRAKVSEASIIARAALVSANAASSPFASSHTGMSLQPWTFCASRNEAGAHTAFGGGVGFASSLAAMLMNPGASPHWGTNAFDEPFEMRRTAWVTATSSVRSK